MPLSPTKALDAEGSAGSWLGPLLNHVGPQGGGEHGVPDARLGADGQQPRLEPSQSRPVPVPRPLAGSNLGPLGKVKLQSSA